MLNKYLWKQRSGKGRGGGRSLDSLAHLRLQTGQTTAEGLVNCTGFPCFDSNRPISLAWRRTIKAEPSTGEGLKVGSRSTPLHNGPPLVPPQETSDLTCWSQLSSQGQDPTHAKQQERKQHGHTSSTCTLLLGLWCPRPVEYGVVLCS